VRHDSLPKAFAEERAGRTVVDWLNVDGSLSSVTCLDAKVLAGTPLLEVVDVHCTAPRSGWSAEESAQRHRFVLTRRGVFAWQTRAETHLVEAGCLLNLEPDQPYRFGHPTDGGDECMLIAVAPETWDRLVNSRELRRCARLSPMNYYQATLFYHAAARYGRDDALLLEEATLPLLDRFVDILAKTTRPRSLGKRRALANHRRLSEAARAYLSSNFCARDELDAIARHVYSSPYHLARVFHAQVGITLHRYRSNLRLAAALTALGEGCDDLAALALRLGYAGHAHFSTAFREAFGCSPSVARTVLTRATLSEMHRVLQADDSL
jgi:AraC family transcriptional regulator